MFENFQKAVLEAYKDFQKNNPEGRDRNDPSPAILKKWCQDCWAKSLSIEDQIVFKRFFQVSEIDLMASAINRFEIDKFRPLQNFLKGKTKKSPDEDLVKLLAVLIDFKPRPYKTEEWDKKNEIKGTTRSPESKENGSIGDFRPKKNIKPLLALGISVLTVGLGFMLNKTVLENKQCMKWQGDKFVAIHCKETKIGSIALDREILKNFQKITRPDTLTERHEKKVWYSKIDNQIEFFTSAGFGIHPENNQRSIKLATRHVLQKYAGKNTNTP